MRNSATNRKAGIDPLDAGLSMEPPTCAFDARLAGSPPISPWRPPSLEPSPIAKVIVSCMGDHTGVHIGTATSQLHFLQTNAAFLHHKKRVVRRDRS